MNEVQILFSIIPNDYITKKAALELKPPTCAETLIQNWRIPSCGTPI